MPGQSQAKLVRATEIHKAASTVGVLIEPTTARSCCGGARLSKLGEDVNKTLEVIPRRYTLIETVRELQQVTNQITSLQNQATSLVNQARNLANLPYSSLQQLQQSITRTQ